MTKQFKNFDKVQQERQKNEIQLGGEIADVSRIPSRVTLELLEASESGEIDENDPRSFQYALDLVAKVTMNSNPKMDKDFLLDNTDFETLIEVIQYVLQPIKDKSEEVQAKNQQAQAKTDTSKNKKST